MRSNIVFTLTGTDRTGIVEDVTKMLFNLGGNVETSRMARLGGEFAVLMLVSIPIDKLPDLDRSIQVLMSQGFKVTTSPTGHGYAEAHAGWLPYKIQVFGADHEGIIHEIAHTLSKQGVNIESMDTSTSPAPNSGAPLFSLTALVAVPPRISYHELKASLRDAADHAQVDIKLSSMSRK